MSIKEKYLKYKFKYLNLKKEISLQSHIGGADPVNILIVSHNSRIRCLLSNFYSGEEILRFKNAAIIKIEIRPSIQPKGDLAQVRLVYEGEVNNPKKGYIVQTPGKDTQDKKLKEEFPKSNIFYKKDLSTYTGKNYNIYIVRHGEGTHNVKKGEEYEEVDTPIAAEDDKKCAEEEAECEKAKGVCTNPTKLETPELDTDITPAGEAQAKKAGMVLQGIDFSAVFVSDLFRTFQTLNALNINDKAGKKMTPYVLPCSHELLYLKDPTITCDNHRRNSRCWLLEKGRALRFAPENVSLCRKHPAREKEERCINHAARDWSYYDGVSDDYCKGSNMVEKAIDITEEIIKNRK
jgi:broad specificity phosphatase PhoE